MALSKASSIDFVINQKFSSYEQSLRQLKLYAEVHSLSYYYPDCIKYNNKKKGPVDVPACLKYYILKVGCTKGGAYTSKSKGIWTKAYNIFIFNNNY